MNRPTRQLNFPPSPLTLALLLSALVLLAPLGACGDEASLTARYFDGLRSRQLYEVAELYGRDQLLRDDLLPEERLEFTIELSRTLADHAMHAGDAQQQAKLWTEAREILNTLIQQTPQQQLSLEFQLAQLDALRGQSLRYQSQIAPYDHVLRDQAAKILVQAIEQFRAVQRSAVEILKGLGQATSSASPYTESELAGLVAQVKQSEATALFDLAMVLPSDSPDRAVALIDAAKRLKELPKSSSGPGKIRAAEVQLLYARCLRLQRHYQQSLDLLNQFSKAGANSVIGDRATGERIRALLGMKRTDEAAKLIDDFTIAGRELPAELEFLNVLILSTQWQQQVAEGNSAAATGLLELIHQQAEKAQKQTGGYWGARAWALWEFNQESSQYGEEVALAIREARALYTHGKVLDAIERYGQAASTAFRTGQRDLAFDLAFTRASLQLRTKQYDVAARAFGELFEKFPQNARAADASLLRAFALGQVYNTRRTQSKRKEYTQALEQHREQFADHKTSAAATWMLAELEEQRLQTTVALRLYQLIPADHARGPAALVAIARCYEKILSRLQSLGRPMDSWLEIATTELQEFLPQPPNPGSPLTESQCEIATYLAKIYLHATPPNFAAADAVLARVFDGRATGESTNYSPQLRKTLAAAMQLRVVSLAGQNRLADAGKLLNQLSETSPVEMLGILGGLSKLVEGAGNETGRDVGALQLQAVEKLDARRAQLTPAQAKRLDQCRAQAYEALGRIDEAIELYEALRETFPKDRELQRNLGEALIHCGTQRCLNQATQLWARLEVANKSGTPRWLNARYYRALTAFTLEDYDLCHKLTGIAAQLYPELGGAELKARYEDLSKQCDAQRAKNGTQSP
ncbi:hypothetical protein CA54_03120 [Symmachiella macrocystis]|uniref:Tetratricopeptide repeat protein n=1 Tax=Symmachiella macrocystis TaxID=2527985 RepID=A0A5C6BHB1_9PLAN|nr:tetratricopeptide repeat protein [Symmachiella macrocystis]TWU11505.1 hypothetical protein CA54_03120 [Symmachiella macrocystis]